MANKTLLNGVNEVLKKAKVLDADAGLLTSLTESAKQMYIDSAVQALNEALDELYSVTAISKPNQLKEGTITLVTSTKAYALATDMIMLRPEYHLIDETNNHQIEILDENGYWQIIEGDFQQNDTGLPAMAAIRPTDGKLVFERTPTSVENGRVYKYRYDKEMELDTAADEFPFNNTVFRALIPAATELWKLHHQQEFIERLYNNGMARAARALRALPARTSWDAPRSSGNITDPFDAAPVS